ncbi:hypothetical protein LTR27_011484 [Elasticomyces elasticus]|nr:hypothetical protein LTR27_011484 [Elasticomyces elasticus]
MARRSGSQRGSAYKKDNPKLLKHPYGLSEYHPREPELLLEGDDRHYATEDSACSDSEEGGASTNVNEPNVRDSRRKRKASDTLESPAKVGRRCSAYSPGKYAEGDIDIMRNHGIHIRLYDSDGYIGEYDAPVPADRTDIKGKLTTALVSRPSGREFTVEVDLRDFQLYSASGVAVTIACGHGLQPPGAFEHVQYYWIEGKDMKTHAFDFGSYDTWEDECAAETVKIPYTMPPPRCDMAGDVVASTSLEPFYATKGSVAVYVQRGHVVNGHHTPWQLLPGGTTDRDMNTKGPPTEPPIRRIGIFQNSPITIGSISSTVSMVGLVFSSSPMLVLPEDCAGKQLRAHDPTPDHDNADIGNVGPHEHDTEDSDSQYGTDESNGDSSVTASDTDSNGSVWDTSDADLDLATRFPPPVAPTRKRKRDSDNVPKHNGRLRRGGRQSSTLVQPSYSKIHETDEDDEELLPTKAESPHPTTAFNKAVTTLGASQASRQVPWRGTAPRSATVARPAVEGYEEDLYGDSRHPSLYNESAVEQRNAAAPDDAESQVGQPHGRLDRDEQFNTGSTERSRATLLRQGQPPTPIDLTTDEGEDFTQVKQEVAEPHGSEERNPALATAEDVASDDEDGLKILVEEIRLKREDVRLQMEELKLRKKLRALEKNRGSTRK